MSFQAPGTAKLIRTYVTLVVAHAGVFCHMASKVGGGEAAHPTDLAPIGVVATVGSLVVAQTLGCQKTPITL